MYLYKITCHSFFNPFHMVDCHAWWMLKRINRCGLALPWDIIWLQTSSLKVTPSGQGKSVAASRYLLTLTLFGIIRFTKIVTVCGVSLFPVSLKPLYVCNFKSKRGQSGVLKMEILRLPFTRSMVYKKHLYKKHSLHVRKFKKHYLDSEERLRNSGSKNQSDNILT